jgi:molybdopterin converting factor small subunit
VALVRFRGPLKSLAGDQSQHQVAGATVDELLRTIEAEHPAMRGWILDERGVLRRHINVFVNGELGAQDSHVEAEDKIDVLPALSGGA